MPKHYCKHCKGEKELSHFYRTKTKWGGISHRCKKYHAQYIKFWKNKDKSTFLKKERDKYNSLSPKVKKNRHLRKTYGITIAQFTDMLERQQNKCAIGEESLTKNTAHVDHCHKTGKVRGLLCKKCNLGLGNFNDSMLKLNKAITYLRKQK
jgi:hypothetical protein